MQRLNGAISEIDAKTISATLGVCFEEAGKLFVIECNIPLGSSRQKVAEKLHAFAVEVDQVMEIR